MDRRFTSAHPEKPRRKETYDPDYIFNLGLADKSLLLSLMHLHIKLSIFIFSLRHEQSWSDLLAPLANMMKEGYGNESALLILLIFD